MATKPSFKPAGKTMRLPSSELVKPTNRKDYTEQPKHQALFKPQSDEQDVVKLPPPPATLRDAGKKRWDECGESLIRRGLWSLDYMASLEHLCRLYDQLDAVQAAMTDVDGTEILMVASSWGPKPNPLLQTRTFMMTSIRNMLADFGMTPNSARGAAPATGSRQTSKSGIQRRDRSSAPK